MAVLFMTTNACKHTKQKVLTQQHQVEIHNPGLGMIYIDKVPAQMVMSEADTSEGITKFCCYQVGIIDSGFVAKATDKKTLELGKYYQYDMQKDWFAMINGDSLLPVFFQPKTRKNANCFEGILVFETPKEKDPDTLVYKDSFGQWGTQNIIFKKVNK
ncbi:MAG TPA: hypothetical protein VFN30_04265 [Chitinophagaceae bacterium]|nr:hypothetical protein [Chitinophagaceae bacterium]